MSQESRGSQYGYVMVRLKDAWNIITRRKRAITRALEDGLAILVISHETEQPVRCEQLAQDFAFEVGRVGYPFVLVDEEFQKVPPGSIPILRLRTRESKMPLPYGVPPVTTFPTVVVIGKFGPQGMIFKGTHADFVRDGDQLHIRSMWEAIRYLQFRSEIRADPSREEFLREGARCDFKTMSCRKCQATVVAHNLHTICETCTGGRAVAEACLRGVHYPCERCHKLEGSTVHDGSATFTCNHCNWPLRDSRGAAVA